MVVALSIIVAFFVIVMVFLVAPVRISGMASGDLYNGGAGFDIRVLPFGGALGAGVLRPEGGEFRLLLYVFGCRLLNIPLPKKGKDKETPQASFETSTDWDVGETIEPIDIDDIGEYKDFGGSGAKEARVDSAQSSEHDDTAKSTDADHKKKGKDFKMPRKPLMERIRNFRANAGKYWRWVKTVLGDLWQIVRIELLAGDVTVGLVNHPATVGGLMGGFAVVNAVLPRPFRIRVRPEFTRTTLDGRIEVEITVYLHRFWTTLVRRRRMILDVWREYRQSQAKEAEILSVDDVGKDDVREDEPLHTA